MLTQCRHLAAANPLSGERVFGPLRPLHTTMPHGPKVMTAGTSRETPHPPRSWVSAGGYERPRRGLPAQRVRAQGDESFHQAGQGGTESANMCMSPGEAMGYRPQFHWDSTQGGRGRQEGPAGGLRCPQGANLGRRAPPAGRPTSQERRSVELLKFPTPSFPRFQARPCQIEHLHHTRLMSFYYRFAKVSTGQRTGKELPRPGSQLGGGYTAPGNTNGTRWARTLRHPLPWASGRLAVGCIFLHSGLVGNQHQEGGPCGAGQQLRCRGARPQWDGAVYRVLSSMPMCTNSSLILT